ACPPCLWQVLCG
nr:Chain E, ALA-CYS-PRO-PRO-CYS-LEU-TRP-GLN-VAL-LEU-CYS-GLY [synthetic construct]4TWT_F Chain F, ALA-CYS-PRO-PRO-CYS-LEU-TRP-GLN-VAL-LEU-CYS-GLY [synthetic construct]